MIPWSATMSSALIRSCVLTTWLVASIGAITVSIERSDIKAPPTRSSMIANGWRPLANAYEDTIGTNVSPSSHLERNLAPLHPVLNKYQEHMATSEKMKLQRKSKPPPPSPPSSLSSNNNGQQEYSPPSILGTFTVFGHAATKARGEAHPNKHSGSETREYTFLIPPPKDVYRFELDSHRKAILRDGGSYIRPPQYIQNIHQPQEPVRSASYFVKGYQSSTNSPSLSSPSGNSKNRPPFISYTAPQYLQPPRHHPAKPFESLKVNNAKPYLQPPSTEMAGAFGKEKLSEHDHRQIYDRYQAQSHNAQILSPAGTGNFFSQINHPSHHYKTSYERDPAFLVHESHEVSYVTPPSIYNNYNFRPSIPYDTLLPPGAYSSSPTATPSTTAAPSRIQESNKFKPNEVIVREDYKRPGTQAMHIKQHENSLQSEVLPTQGVTSTYYVSEHQDLTPPPSAWPVQKNKYTSDINEVLPRVNPPAKFSQEVVNSNQIPQIPKIVYVRPPQQYQSSLVPHDVRPQTSSPEYETPESISLKHFNEQQYLIQQQLIQRDRQRLAEQERQQQLEIERQQQEELKKRQEELKELIQRQKEEEEEQAEADKLAANLAAEKAQKEAVKESEEQPPTYTIQLAGYDIPKYTTETIIRVQEQTYVDQGRIQEQSQSVTEDPPVQPLHVDVQEESHHRQQQEQQQEYQEPEQEPKPYRPQKPLRDQYRRRKPTTSVYDVQPTEAPTQSPETSYPLETLPPQTQYAEEVPVQTTIPPETVTVPTVLTTSVSQRQRIRRPGSPLRRRRPSTTTTEESITVPNFNEQDFLKFDKAEEIQQQQLDNSRRRKVRPTQSPLDHPVVTERRPNIRKRPGHRNRVNPGEPFDAEIVTEIVQSPANVYREPTESIRYAEQVTNQPVQYYDYTSTRSQFSDDRREEITESPQIDYYTELSRNRDENGDQHHDDRQNANVVTNIPLEDLFARTEGHYYDRATLASSTSTTSTTTSTTTTTTTTTPAPISTTAKTHKMRPLRYGNTTRPRFSIKDYKSRLDYKTRLSQVSTTEATVSSAPPHSKQRLSNYKSQSQQNAADNHKDTSSRYKYMSRANYRTTTATPTSSEREQHTADDITTSTTERSHRFVPKRRPVSGNVYRSRITATTSSPNRSQKDNETPSKYSTARPENVFSSSIRRRPTMRSRLHSASSAQKEAASSERKEQFATEMTAEETSFYSAITTSASTTGSANEISPVEKSVAGDAEVKLATDEEEKREEAAFQSSDPTDSADRQRIENAEEEVAAEDAVEESKDDKEDTATKLPEKVLTKKPEEAESTTHFVVAADEEELFAKASQSVADLTSSASALYDKPGMFKAVSPESRVVASHFKITTDEPTLPIEAFFQELSKKN